MHWTVHLEGGPRRVNHAAVAIGNNIYSFGGYCTGEDYSTFIRMDVHILNTINNRWYVVQQKPDDPEYPQVPFQRYGHTAVAYKHLVYVWGGRNDEMICNKLFCFDTRTLQWSAPQTQGVVPEARDGHSACVVGNKMYIFGGFENYLHQFSRDLHCLDLDTMTWKYITTTGEPPSYRDFHTATPINNDRIYIFGGRGDRNSPYHSQDEIYNSEIVYIDLKTNQWHLPPTFGCVPVGRRSHSAFVYNNRIYIFGGYNGIYDQHFNDLYCFDPAHNRWTLMESFGSPPCPRRRHVSLVIGSKVYLFGGTRCPTNERQSSSQLLDFNDTHVLDFAPSLKTLAILTVLKNKMDWSWLPNDIKWEIRMMTTNNNISRPLNHTG